MHAERGPFLFQCFAVYNLDRQTEGYLLAAAQRGVWPLPDPNSSHGEALGWHLPSGSQQRDCLNESAGCWQVVLWGYGAAGMRSQVGGAAARHRCAGFCVPGWVLDCQLGLCKFLLCCGSFVQAVGQWALSTAGGSVGWSGGFDCLLERAFAGAGSADVVWWGVSVFLVLSRQVCLVDVCGTSCLVPGRASAGLTPATVWCVWQHQLIAQDSQQPVLARPWWRHLMRCVRLCNRRSWNVKANMLQSQILHSAAQPTGPLPSLQLSQPARLSEMHSTTTVSGTSFHPTQQHTHSCALVYKQPARASTVLLLLMYFIAVWVLLLTTITTSLGQGPA